MRILTKYSDSLAVKHAAEHLLLTNGETTAREVCDLLRTQGYVAFLEQVEECLELIATKQGWDYCFNGHTRIYKYLTEVTYRIAFDVPKFSLN